MKVERMFGWNPYPYPRCPSCGLYHSPVDIRRCKKCHKFFIVSYHDERRLCKKCQIVQEEE